MHLRFSGGKRKTCSQTNHLTFTINETIQKAATANSVILGILLAIVGGFLDAYTYISRNGVFANAQSGNIVLLGVKAAQGQWTEAFLHIPPILAFILGVAVTETFKQPRFVSVLPDTSRIVLLLEIVVLIIVGFYHLVFLICWLQ